MSWNSIEKFFNFFSFWMVCVFIVWIRFLSILRSFIHFIEKLSPKRTLIILYSYCLYVSPPPLRLLFTVDDSNTNIFIYSLNVSFVNLPPFTHFSFHTFCVLQMLGLARLVVYWIFIVEHVAFLFETNFNSEWFVNHLIY